MNSYPAKQLQILTHHQQNRIWLKRISEHSSPVFWWLAGLFILSAIIHQLLLPLNTLVVVAIAIVPSLVVLIWMIIITKPLATEGAAEADALVGANSLFVSSWELSLYETHLQGTEKLLLERTEKMLPSWSEKLKHQPRKTITSTRLIMITLTFFGLFFLMMPTHVKTEDAIVVSTSTSDNASQYQNDPTPTLSDLFTKVEKISKESSEQRPVNSEQHQQSEHQPNLTTDETSDIQAQNNQQAEAKITNNQSLTKTKGKQLNLPKGIVSDSLQSEGQKMADRTAGNDAAKQSDKILSQSDGFEQVKLIEISSDVDSQSTAFDDTMTGENLVIAKPEQAIFNPETVRHSESVSKPIPTKISTTLMSAEQRNIVVHYFKQLEEMNEANE